MVLDVHVPLEVADDGRGTSFVAEAWDDEGNPSGRFDAHWESDDGAEFREGPQGVTANEAVDWARRQAAVVIVRTGEGDAYSAGTQDVEDVPRRWPAEGMSFARRPLATRWEVAIRVPAAGPFAKSSGAPLLDLVARSPGVTAARLTTRDDGEPWVVCVIEARSEAEAAKRAGGFVPAGASYRPRREAWTFTVGLSGATYEVATEVLRPIREG